MTGVQAIIVVLIRLWAAGVFIGALLSLPSIIDAIMTPNLETDLLTKSYFFNTFILFLIGGAVWFLARWMANRIAPNSTGQDIAFNVDADTLVAIGSFLIGANYLITYGVRLLRAVSYAFLVRAGETFEITGQLGALHQKAINWEELTTNLFVVIVALIMMFRPAYLVRIFNWLRSSADYKAAVDKKFQTTEEGS